jgi:tRNA(fMet)-specific endonuclease VapC
MPMRAARSPGDRPAVIRYLLDSNALSEPLRPVPDRSFMDKLREHDRELATSATVWNELVYGMERLEPSARRLAIEGYLAALESGGLPVLPYDREAARWQGRARARLEAAGRSVGYQDGQIAAVAQVRGLVLVTRNARHFEAFEGLRVETWFSG